MNSSKLHHPKYFSDVCIEAGEDYYDYENFNVDWGSMENYEVLSKIGRGKYSEVFEGKNSLN
jgi:casein kinase II subunit alpha